MKKCFFLPLFAQKKYVRKRSNFWQEPWTSKMSIFFDSLRTSLLRSKKLYFFPRISKNVTFWLFLLKKIHIRKTSIFWRKQWTNPFPKCRYFLTLLELHFSGANSIQKKLIRKGRFFDKNHGLTPLQNVDFLAFFGTFLLWSKKHSFLSRIWKNVSFWPFLVKKKTYEKKFDLLTKAMD